MIRHKVYVRHNNTKDEYRLSLPLIRHCVQTALRLEGVDRRCEVSVYVTDDRDISEINRRFLGIYKPTDVLSFPMQEFSQPGWADPGTDAIDPETGLIPLGEIVLASQRVDKQAREYGHSREKETAYLTIHSVLHLLGYDHTDEAEGKKQMREREKEIIRELGL